jgi:glycosyltransferase involved in cell wall biosynthesis
MNKIKIMDKKIGIIIPAFNEEKTIKDVILGFHNSLPSAELCVVDNASTDQTLKIAQGTLQSLRVPYQIISEEMRGKANALRRAFIELNWDIYIMVDADLTYDPLDIEKLLKPILTNKADIVVGDRLSNDIYKKQNDRRFHEFGNRLIRKIINLIFHTRLNDIFSGYRVLNKRFAKNMPILTNNFEVETEMTISALIYKFRIKEIPINYKKRISGSISKLNTFKDGVRIFNALLMIIIDYKPLLFFGSFGFILLMLSLLIGAPVINEFIITRYVTHVPLAILATGTMISSLIFFTIAMVLNVITRSNLRTMLLQIQKADN